MTYTRRELGKLVLILPVAGLVPRALFGQQRAKPNSTFAGVTVGINVPYSFGTRTMSGDEVLDKTLQLGISAVELRSQPVELSPEAQRSLARAEEGQQRKKWISLAPPRATTPCTFMGSASMVQPTSRSSIGCSDRRTPVGP